MNVHVHVRTKDARVAATGVGIIPCEVCAATGTVNTEVCRASASVPSSPYLSGHCSSTRLADPMHDLSVVCVQPGQGGEAFFVGEARCKSCHGRVRLPWPTS